MSASPLPITFESQVDPQTNRGCGAACLSMVYKSFGKDVPQAAIWPLIAKPNRFGSVASTTHLMAQHALSQGLSAVVIQARHPLQVLRLCRDSGMRAILNHRLQPGSSAGHFTVLVDVDDKNVVLHDPFFGPSRILSHADLAQLWQPSSANSEIVGNILIGIASDPPTGQVCEFCHTEIPPKVDCPRCKKAVALSPAALLGCIRDGCIARMWNYVCCPACDFMFNETGTSSADAAGAGATPASIVPEPQNLDKLFEELDKFCSHMLSIPGAADHADLKTQLGILQAGKERLKLAQMEEHGYMKGHTERLGAFAQQSKKNSDAHRKKVEDMKIPPPPLDGNALGKALLKDLGFN